MFGVVLEKKGERKETFQSHLGPGHTELCRLQLGEVQPQLHRQQVPVQDFLLEAGACTALLGGLLADPHHGAGAGAGQEKNRWGVVLGAVMQVALGGR